MTRTILLVLLLAVPLALFLAYCGLMTGRRDGAWRDAEVPEFV